MEGAGGSGAGGSAMGAAASCKVPRTFQGAAPQVALNAEFPDEREAHEATMMIFPAKHSYKKDHAKLQREFAELANAIAQREAVHVFVYPADEHQARKLLGDTVVIHTGEAYSIDWARDNCPMVVRNAVGERTAVCFGFNGWGKKYKGWQKDVGVNVAIAQALKLPVVQSDLVLEGGAVEIGTLKGELVGIATEQCVLNRNRTSWSKAQVEAELKALLGLARVIWIPQGLNPDPITDGHVDGLLKFVADDTVLLHTTDHRKDVNYKPCLEAKAILEASGLKVIELPLAEDIVHMNFYIGSGGSVIYAPICGDPRQDDPALAILHTLFPTVIPITAVAIGKAGGGVHCYTMQLPT